MSIESWIKVWKAGFTITFVGAFQFLVCCVISMVLYPGGNLLDTGSAGYSLSENYLSDLGRDISISGRDNQTGAKIFNTSLFILGLTSLPFFAFMPTHAYDRTGWLSVAAVLGSGSSFALMVMGTSPCDIAAITHYLALLCWMACIFLSSSIHAICLLTSKDGASVAISLVSVAVAMLAVSYFYHGTETAAAVVFRREIPLKSVLLQKLLVISALIWLFTVSAKLLLTEDFSEFRDREISEDTKDYLNEIEQNPWGDNRGSRR